MLKIQKQRKISQAKTKNFKKISMMLINAFLIIGIFSILSGCNSKEQPIDKIYTGRYIYFPEGSLDVGANSYITLRQSDVRMDMVYCVEITVNGSRETNVVLMSDKFYYFSYTTTSFDISPQWYTIAGIQGSNTDFYISLTGSLGLKDLSVNGVKYKNVPTVKMYGTRMILTGRVPGYDN